MTPSAAGERRALAERRLDDRDFACVWADSVHSNVRLEEERLCCSSIVGDRVARTKELAAIANSYWASMQSSADLRRGLKPARCGVWCSSPGSSVDVQQNGPEAELLRG